MQFRTLSRCLDIEDSYLKKHASVVRRPELTRTYPLGRRGLSSRRSRLNGRKLCEKMANLYLRSSFIAVPVYADMQICRFLPVLCGLPPRSAAHSSPCPPPQGPFPGSLGKRISLGHGPLCSFAPGENSRPRIRTLSLYTANNPGHTGPDALGFICKYYY